MEELDSGKSDSRIRLEISRRPEENGLREILDYRVKFSARRRRLALTVSRADGKLTVLAPVGTADDEISEAVRSHRHWIDRHRKAFLNKAPPQKLEIGAGVWFLGQSYRLKYDASVALVPHICETYICVGDTAAEHIRRQLENFYLTQAEKLLPALVKELAAAFQLDYSAVRISRARSRWGSCSGRKNLNFSWRLLVFPESVIRSVIAHELAHLLEMNHSERFYRHWKNMSPNYKKEINFLKNNGEYYGLL